MAPALLSRTLDPLLGIFTGGFAYYLFETNPRTALPREERLSALVRWKLTKWRDERERKLAGGGEEVVDWTAITASIDTEKDSKTYKGIPRDVLEFTMLRDS